MSIKNIRTSLRHHRAAVSARQDMLRQLSVYTTPAEIEDMLAAVDGHDSPDANLMREVLGDKLARAYRDSARPAFGMHVAA